MHTHIAFSDESNWNSGRFRSISLISLRREDLDKAVSELNKELLESGVSEFKWKNLNGAKQRFAAEKIISIFFKLLDEGKIRLDVILWDIKDSRHTIPSRDDVANLSRMYYHLIRNVFKNKWPDEAVWKFVPDQHSGIDWLNLKDILNVISKKFKEGGPWLDRDHSFLFDIQEFHAMIENLFHVMDLQEGESKEEPLVQLADLFAGLCCFSWETYDKYEVWLRNSGELLLVSEEELKHSKRDEERFAILKLFDDQCKKRKLSVSLKSFRGLKSMDPEKRVNIWIYEPQHTEDKAPQKSK